MMILVTMAVLMRMVEGDDGEVTDDGDDKNDDEDNSEDDGGFDTDGDDGCVDLLCPHGGLDYFPK